METLSRRPRASLFSSLCLMNSTSRPCNDRRGGDEATIPHKVVALSVLGNKSPVRAWREYKGILQKEVADALGISQAAYSQMEKPDANLRTETIEKIARIFELDLEQLNF